MAIARDPEQSYKLTIKQNTVAIVTDGSAVLGLGNLGPEAALPVMEGKAMLFKEFAGIDAFPICLATQDTQAIVETVKSSCRSVFFTVHNILLNSDLISSLPTSFH